MLPLRTNRKPQLLPIKQLLTKQREEHSRAEEEHSLNTDDYLLWKSEHEPNEKKTVSFRLDEDDIKLKARGHAFSDDKHFKRPKHEIFLHDEGDLWDSDEVDESLRNRLDTLTHLKNYEYENARDALPESDDKFRNPRKSSSARAQKKKDSDLIKKLIETLDLPIKKSIVDMQHNLSALLESKIAEEMSVFKTNFKLDKLNEIEDKITSICKTLREFEKSHQLELVQLKADLLNHINSVSVNQTSKSDDFKSVEERICNQITENFSKTVQNLEKQLKQLDLKQESYETNVTNKHEKFFNDNSAKLQELDAKIESLKKEMSKISEVVADTRRRNPEPSINVAPRRPMAEETPSFKIDINSSNFYQNVDAELEQYRNAYIGKSSSSDGYQKFKSSLYATNKNKWKPW